MKTITIQFDISPNFLLAVVADVFSAYKTHVKIPDLTDNHRMIVMAIIRQRLYALNSVYQREREREGVGGERKSIF